MVATVRCGVWKGYLTDEHAAVSYGQPVLVIESVAHGPGDVIDEMTAADWIRGWRNAGARTAEAKELSARFLGE